jgi:hypothetical protein
VWQAVTSGSLLLTAFTCKLGELDAVIHMADIQNIKNQVITASLRIEGFIECIRSASEIKATTARASTSQLGLHVTHPYIYGHEYFKNEKNQVRVCCVHQEKM